MEPAILIIIRCVRYTSTGGSRGEDGGGREGEKTEKEEEKEENKIFGEEGGGEGWSKAGVIGGAWSPRNGDIGGNISLLIEARRDGRT